MTLTSENVMLGNEAWSEEATTVGGWVTGRFIPILPPLSSLCFSDSVSVSASLSAFCHCA